MKISPELKRLNKNGLISIILPGYVVDKWLISAYFFVAIIILLVALQADGALNFNENHYLTCEGSAPCWNPYYSPMPTDCPAGLDCSREYLNPGETWGKAPSYVYNIAPGFVTLLMVLAIVTNHFLYNQKYDYRAAIKRWQK